MQTQELTPGPNPDLGSTVALSDDTGSVTTRYTYGPFGSTTVTGPSTNPFQFTGRENDGTGLYYYRARYYSPSRSRFLSEDPLEFGSGDSNLYSYVLNNPENLVDPSGLDGIYVHYDGYPVNTGFGFNAPLGHAGVVAIDPVTGTTAYFEYGRYGGEFGRVRQRSIPNVQIGPNGLPTPSSLNNLYDYLSRNVGKGYPVSAQYNHNADYKKIVDFARRRKNDPNRRPYSWNPLNPNHCKTFAKEAIDAGLK